MPNPRTTVLSISKYGVTSKVTGDVTFHQGFGIEISQVGQNLTISVRIAKQITSRLLDELGAKQGSVAFRSDKIWKVLEPGTSGYALITGGPGVDPSWAGVAPLASPTFTGTPAAPTAAGGTDTTQIATTAFVQAAVAAGGGNLLAVRMLTSGTVYTPTAGTTRIYVECQGGGGGGGGADSTAGDGGCGTGGGGGTWGARWYTGIGAGPYTYAIGAAGAAGVASGGGAGGAGGNTTFTDGTTLLTAPGGAGGGGMNSSGGNTFTENAAGGAAATNANVNRGGDPGSQGLKIGFGLVLGGLGGGSMFGGGGLSRYDTAGSAAVGYGGGGGAGNAATADRAGGAGTAGVIRIWEFA